MAFGAATWGGAVGRRSESERRADFRGSQSHFKRERKKRTSIPAPKAIVREVSPSRPTYASARPLACPFGARASPSATLAPLGSIGAAALFVVGPSLRLGYFRFAPIARFPTAALGTPTPAPPSACAKSPRSLCLDCSCARRGGRLLRWLSNRVSRLRISSGLCARSGATRAAYAAQNRARRFSTKQACRKTAALGFPPPAGVAPYPLREGQHRARPTARAAFGYSRGDWDSTRTLRGHFALAARIVRPSIGGASGH